MNLRFILNGRSLGLGFLYVCDQDLKKHIYRYIESLFKEKKGGC